jgi:hypothetical protein
MTKSIITNISALTKKSFSKKADYIKDGKPIGVSVSRHHGRLSRKGSKGAKLTIDSTYERVCVRHILASCIS